MTTKFLQAIKNQISLTQSDWESFLQQAHKQGASMTPRAFGQYKTSGGKTSYELLAQTLAPEHKKILDLACGDAHLFQFIFKVNPEAVISGVDMSEGELAIARQKYGNHSLVQLVQARAESVPLPSDSQDALLCHMALMLMFPIDSVIKEMERLLRPSGILSGVVGGAAKEGEFILEIQKTLTRYLRNKYNVSQLPSTGDPRFRSQEGIADLFTQTQFESPEFENIDLQVSGTIDEILNQWKEMYFVSVLPSSEQGELLQEIRNLLSEYQQPNGIVNYSFPLLLFKTTRK